MTFDLSLSAEPLLSSEASVMIGLPGYVYDRSGTGGGLCAAWVTALISSAASLDINAISSRRWKPL